MKCLILFLGSLIISAMLSMVVQAQVKVNGKGIESAYCAAILAKVENVAGCKAKEGVTVAVEDRINSGFAVPLASGFPVLGLYEQDRRVISLEREALCPWLIAHEMAHVVYTDNYSFHPESWADVTADAVAGNAPKWLGLQHGD